MRFDRFWRWWRITLAYGLLAPWVDLVGIWIIYGERLPGWSLDFAAASHLNVFAYLTLFLQIYFPSFLRIKWMPRPERNRYLVTAMQATGYGCLVALGTTILAYLLLWLLRTWRILS
jgi:hypothetical protein